MADTSRIEELRRRVQRDPASIAFAQLAEEYRRAGRYKEAIETCESGLVHHPGYLSARVTLGRAFLETGELDAAQMELKQVLRAAPENLAALRGLAEIHHRRGELHEALAHYRTALEFARHDPELEHLVHQIEQELEPRAAAPVVVDGLSFDEVKAIIGETPTIEETARIDETPIIGETPRIEETPRIDETPRIEETPRIDETPRIEETPIIEETPTIDETPIIGGTPISAPIVEDRPIAEDTPILETAPIVELTPIIETASIIGDTPVIETAPILEATPILEPTPIIEPPPIIGDTPIIETSPILEATPIIGTTPIKTEVDALERWLEVILAERQRRG